MSRRTLNFAHVPATLAAPGPYMCGAWIKEAGNWSGFQWSRSDQFQVPPADSGGYRADPAAPRGSQVTLEVDGLRDSTAAG